MPIIAEMLITCKLKDVSDLTTISTYGFSSGGSPGQHQSGPPVLPDQDQALAMWDMCDYKDGVTVAPWRPMAANPGTTITIEAFSYNIPTYNTIECYIGMCI